MGQHDIRQVPTIVFIEFGRDVDICTYIVLLIEMKGFPINLPLTFEGRVGSGAGFR
jgi:hypothetical protein